MCMFHHHDEDRTHDLNRAEGPSATHAPTHAVWVVALIGFMAIAGYFLWTKHRAHVIPFLPYALLLLCPLMHLFMHHGHGRNR